MFGTVGDTADGESATLVDLSAAQGLLSTLAMPGEHMIPARDMRRKVRGQRDLPPMPETAKRLIDLASIEQTNVNDLASIVEQDPALTAQVIRWASSAMYGYRGELTSIQEAIARVLGYELVLNLSLGLASAGALKIPRDGPLGARAFWERALQGAVFGQTLAKDLSNPRIRPGDVYVCALLRDIGHLVLGQIFPDEYECLNQAVEANPNMSMHQLERCILGVDRCELGSWLMQAWDMPEAIRMSVGYHLSPYYQGACSPVVNMVSLVDVLFNDVQGPTRNHLLEATGVDEAAVNRAMEFFKEQQGEVQSMAMQMAA